MNRSQMLSNTRTEIRCRRSGYRTEAAVCQWITRFLDETGIDHSAQLAEWQIDHFIASLKESKRYTTADILQARSALHLLFEKITGSKNDSEVRRDMGEIIRISA